MKTIPIVLFGCVAVSHCPETLAFSSLHHGKLVVPSRIRRKSGSLKMVFEVSSAAVEQVSTDDLLDKILDESLRFSARRPIMIQFDPSSKAIWSHWRGTVFAETWRSCVNHVLWGVFVYFLLQKNPFVTERLAGFDRLWGQVLSVTTFTLTFFVNQSYTIWRTCLQICRTLQGRLNDLAMAIAGCAERADPFDDDGVSAFTTNSRRVLRVVGRYIRLFNILSYASLTRSHRPLITPQGMRRMVARGLLTSKERKILINASIPATQLHNAVLMWIFRSVIEARKAGHIDGGFGFEQQIMAKVQEIRAQSNSMESVLKGRMPFAYAHIVQVLVDVALWMYPVMAYSSGTSLTVGLIGTALLTTFYQGLFDLAKQFLDPFHNENFWNGDDPLVVETLIAETNAGSVRWANCLEAMPIPYRQLKKGDLEDYMLPDEGYTVPEAYEAEEKSRKEAKIKVEQVSLPKVGLEESEVDSEVELEQTKRILNAPPGLDFVPGLDDNGESLAYHFRNSTGNERDDDGILDEYLEAAEEEYRESMQSEEVAVGSGSQIVSAIKLE